MQTHGLNLGQAQVVVSGLMRECGVVGPTDLIVLMAHFTKVGSAHFVSELAGRGIEVTEDGFALEHTSIFEWNTAVSTVVWDKGVNSFTLQIDDIRLGDICVGVIEDSRVQSLYSSGGKKRKRKGMRSKLTNYCIGALKYDCGFGSDGYLRQMDRLSRHQSPWRFRNTTIKCEYDCDKGTVEYYVNDLSQGVAFRDLTVPMRAAISMYRIKGDLKVSVLYDD